MVEVGSPAQDLVGRVVVGKELVGSPEEAAVDLVEDTAALDS